METLLSIVGFIISIAVLITFFNMAAYIKKIYYLLMHWGLEKNFGLKNDNTNYKCNKCNKEFNNPSYKLVNEFLKPICPDCGNKNIEVIQ